MVLRQREAQTGAWSQGPPQALQTGGGGKGAKGGKGSPFSAIPPGVWSDAAAPAPLLGADPLSPFAHTLGQLFEVLGRRLPPGAETQLEALRKG